MSHRIALFFTVCFIALGYSCGDSKKLTAANNQITELQNQVNQLNSDKTNLTNQLSALQQQVNNLNTSNGAMMQEYNRFKTTCQQNAAKLAVIQAYLDDQYKTLMEMEKKLEAAEADFKDKGVDVSYKDGLVYCRMADNLMYKSGSDVMDPKGKAALGNLAAVLNNYPKMKVIVLGNTDNVQFKGKRDNWNLSTERANGVVRILRDDYHVDPSRLTSAGKGKYNPVADNSTAEGRAQNRRTDIIINPDLIKVWESIQNEQSNN